jgi:hypothetical protein
MQNSRKILKVKLKEIFKLNAKLVKYRELLKKK